MVGPFVDTIDQSAKGPSISLAEALERRQQKALRERQKPLQLPEAELQVRKRHALLLRNAEASAGEAEALRVTRCLGDEMRGEDFLGQVEAGPALGRFSGRGVGLPRGLGDQGPPGLRQETGERYPRLARRWADLAEHRDGPLLTHFARNVRRRGLFAILLGHLNRSETLRPVQLSKI